MTAFARNRADPDLRRGACPALSAPMMTGDGLLARVPLTAAIAPRQLADLCGLAMRHGNGVIDISARGNLQIRGLSEASAPQLEAEVRALDLPLRDGLAVEVPPLAGEDATEIADPRPLADAIRDRARDLQGLAPKMSVIVDGAGRLTLSGLIADIRLVAVEAGGEIRWKILLGGTEGSGRVFNVLTETQAVEATVSLLENLASLGSDARGRDLASGLAPNDFNAATVSPFTLHALSNETFATGIGPAFGQTHAENLITLCAEAARLDIRTVKPALDHSLLFFGSQAACRALTAFGDGNGFITSDADPRGHIAACTGRPACRSGTIATHEIATHAAAECGDLLDGSFKLHVSGCPKGCAHPQATALTLCGMPDHVSLVASAKASGQPFASIAFADTNATLRRLAAIVRSERHSGENSAACLARIGPDRLRQAAIPG
jgi:precorrin-3B synthase